MDALEILLDALIALLSCIGIWTLGRMALDWLLNDLNDPEFRVKEAYTWKKQKSKTK